MTGPLTLDQPGQYRILIQGHLSQGWVKWFGELALTIGYDEAGQPITTLSGMIAVSVIQPIDTVKVLIQNKG